LFVTVKIKTIKPPNTKKFGFPTGRDFFPEASLSGISAAGEEKPREWKTVNAHENAQKNTESQPSHYGVNSFQCPSETTSTVPSTTFIAV